tara:strand:+ start:1107 stop:1280 length:174 start_codon:yes stop_codon:yes gene_type:complete
MVEQEYICAICDAELTDKYFYCYYAGDTEENILCDSAHCHEEWLSNNIIEEEVENES